MTKSYGLLQWASSTLAVVALLLSLAAVPPADVRADEPVTDPGDPGYGGNAGPCDVTCSGTWAKCNGTCDKIKPDCNGQYCSRVKAPAIGWCECKI